jgi:hypothetical protein
VVGLDAWSVNILSENAFPAQNLARHPRFAPLLQAL